MNSDYEAFNQHVELAIYIRMQRCLNTDHSPDNFMTGEIAEYYFRKFGFNLEKITWK